MKQKKSLRRKNHGIRNISVMLVLAITAVAAIIYVGVGTPGGGTSATMTTGEKAPRFALESVNNSLFNLSSYLGKTDVLLFFNEGLTCSPCLQQMVDIDRNYSTFTNMGVTVVSITTNSMSDMRTWSQNSGIGSMMVLPDPSLQVDRQYDTLYAGSMHAGMAPGHTFILIGKDGDIAWRKDYGAYTMYVPMNDLIASVKAAVG